MNLDSYVNARFDNMNKTNWVGISFGLCLFVMAAFHQFKMAPVLSEMARDFGYSPVMSGAYMSCYAVFGLLFARSFGNRMHHGPISAVVRYLLIITILGSLLGYSFPENMLLMLLARSMEGLGACGLSVAGPVIISRFTNIKHQGLSASISALWIPLGVIGAGLVSMYDPTEAYFGIESSWQVGWITAIALSFGLILWGYIYQFRGISLTRSIILEKKDTSLDISHEEEKTHLVWENKNNRQAMVLVALTFMLWACQNMAFMSWLPSYLIENLGYSKDSAALIFIAPVVFICVFNLLAIPLMQRFKPAKLLVYTILGQGISVLSIAMVEGTSYEVLQFPLLLSYGAMAGVTPSCLFRMPNIIFGNHAGTRAFGWMMTGRNIGVLAGPMIVATALQFTETKWDSLSLVITSACILAMIISYKLHKKVMMLNN